jgi:hypothetical protein
MNHTRRTFEDRYLRAGIAEPWFRRHFKPMATRVLAKLVIVGLVFALLGYAGSTLIQKAIAAEPGAPPRESVARLCDPEPETPCIQRAARWASHRFVEGDMGRVHGFRTKRYFRDPAGARRIWVRKIATAVKKYNAHHAHRLHYRGHLVVLHRSSRPWTSRDDGAITPGQIYGMASDSTTCVGLSNYPAWATGSTYCSNTGIKSANTHGLTKSQVQNGGSAVFCGGAVVLGVLGSPETGGSTLFIASWGAAACGWGLWMAGDSG